jgi:hypothetical protein
MKTLNKELGLIVGAKSTPFLTFDASDISQSLNALPKANPIFDELIKTTNANDFAQVTSEAKLFSNKSSFKVTKDTPTEDIQFIIGKLQNEQDAMASLMYERYVAKDFILDIFNNLAIGKDKAQSRAKNFISTGNIDGNYSNKNKEELNRIRKTLINNTRTFLGISLLIQDYKKLISRRAEVQKAINEAISKQDVDTLKKLKPLTTEQENQVSEAIKSITAEQERQKALAEAQKKIDEAKTEEEKKKAQKEYDNLVAQGSAAVGTLSSATGIPKGALYIGIGVAVVIAGVLIYRGIRK